MIDIIRAALDYEWTATELGFIAFAVFCICWCAINLASDLMEEARYVRRRRKVITYATPARVQTETQHQVERLAARVSPAEPASALAGVGTASAGVAVVGTAPTGMDAALDRDSEYGRGTTLVWKQER